jgi:hypothetical protein
MRFGNYKPIIFKLADRSIGIEHNNRRFYFRTPLLIIGTCLYPFLHGLKSGEIAGK